MTKKTTFAFAALAALSLSACQHNPEQCDSFGPGGVPDSTKPRVGVVDGHFLVIDQEPLIFVERKPVTITWRLPAEGGYRFTKDGITFSDGKERHDLTQTPDKEISDCHVSESGREFSCRNAHSRPGRYKYAITVEKREGAKETRLTLDPTVVNF
jgi:hypothetical protein